MRFAKVLIFSILCIVLMSSMGLAQLSGTYFINQNASGADLYGNGGRYFPSFNDALDGLAGTFSVLPDPIVNQAGNEQPLGDIFSMDYFVEGVIGSPTG